MYTQSASHRAPRCLKEDVSQTRRYSLKLINNRLRVI